MTDHIQAEIDRVVLAWYREQRSLAGTHHMMTYNVLIDHFMRDHPRSMLRRVDVDASVRRLFRAGVLVQDGIALAIAPTVAWSPAIFGSRRGRLSAKCVP